MNAINDFIIAIRVFFTIWEFSLCCEWGLDSKWNRIYIEKKYIILSLILKMNAINDFIQDT